MDVVASFIESVSTTKNHEERSRTYLNFQQKITRLEGGQDKEAPPEKSMLALARVMNADAESRIVHLQKACVGVLEMLLVTDILSEDSRTVFIESLLREPASNEAHKLAFKVFKNKVSSEIEANILNPNVIFGTRHSQYKAAIEAISANLPKETSAQFLITKIVPAMYQRHMEDQLRESTIELAMHFDATLAHLSASDQEAFSNTVMGKYCPVITELMEADYENWHKLWIFIVKFCDVKFHSMMVLANRLLRVIEEAFRRRTVPKILRGYECWLAVIENASLNKNHLCSPKQLKLLMTPLKARLSKEPAVLLKRFDAFVLLLVTLQDMAMLGLKDFLVVCFGPFDDNAARPQVNKRIPEMCKKTTVALFDILGHGHCKDENCVRDSFIEFKEPFMVPANFAKCYAILIDSVLECCIVLPSWNSSAISATAVVRCLWFSLLQLCKASDNDIKSECWTKITNKLRALSEKIADNEFCSAILGGFVEASAMLEITALNEIMFDISLNILSRTGEPNNFNAEKIESVVGALLESDNAKCSKIAVGYFNDTNPANMSILCDVWLKCTQSDVPFLLWPIRHLKHFKDLKVFEKTWQNKYAKYSSDSEPIKLSFLQKLEGLFAENPLLSPEIILILHSMSSCDSIATSDFVTKSMRLLGSVLTYPNLSDEDIKTSIAIVTLHLAYIAIPLAEGADEAIGRLCTSVQHLITVHKNLEILPSLEVFLKNQSKTCVAQFAHHLVPLLETVMLNDDSALNICGKLLGMLHVKEPEPLESTPKPTSRSLRMLSMANKSPSNSPSGLRLFAKTKGTPPQKTSSPSTRSKLIMQNTPTSRKKLNVAIDEEKSSDFVKIDTPVKFEPKKLSEHQKEVMLKRREDIPALYQDLSQSQDWSLSQDSSKSARAVTSPSVPVETTKSCSSNNNNESTAMKVSSFKKPRIGKKQRTVKTDLDSSLDSSIDESSGGGGSEKVSPSVASEITSDMFADVVPIIAKETESSESKPSVDETVIKDASDAEDVPRPGSKTRRKIKDPVEMPTQVRKSLRQQERKGREVEGAENTQTTEDTESRSAVSAGKAIVAPIEKTQTPVVKAQAPVSRAQTPVPRAQTPVPRAQTPVSRAQTPVSRAQTPVSRAQTQVPKAQTPVPKAEASIPKAQASVPKTKLTVFTDKSGTPAKSTTDCKTQTPGLTEKTPTSVKPEDVIKVETPKLEVDSPQLSGSARLKSRKNRRISTSTPLKRSHVPAGKAEKETPRKKVKESPSGKLAAEPVVEDLSTEQKLLKQSATLVHGVTPEETVECVKDKEEIEMIQQILDSKIKSLDTKTKTRRESRKPGEKRKRESSSPEHSKKQARKHVDSPIVMKVMSKSADNRGIKLKKIEEFWPSIRKSEIIEPETMEEVAPPQVDVTGTETTEAKDAVQVPQIELPETERSEFLEHLQLKSNIQIEEEKTNEAPLAAEAKKRSPRKSPNPGKRSDVRKRNKRRDPFLVPRRKTSRSIFSRVKKRRVTHVTAETSEVSDKEEEKNAGVASNPKVASPKPASASAAASRSDVASPPKVVSSPKAPSSPKIASPPKVASPKSASSTKVEFKSSKARRGPSWKWQLPDDHSDAASPLEIVSSPKVPSSKVASPPKVTSPKSASSTKVASPPKVASPLKSASSPKLASLPKVASPLKVESPPKVASSLIKDEVDDEAEKRVLVERLLVAEEAALRIQENRSKFDGMKPCHVQLEAMQSQSAPTSPVKLPEMRQRARSVDHIREAVDEIRRKLRPRSFPEDAQSKTLSRTITFSNSAESTLGSQDIIESSQSTVVEMAPPAKRVTRQSTSPKVSPKSHDISPKITSPSDSLADTESCASVVRSLTPKEVTPPRAQLTSSERLMADMSTETMHSESLIPTDSQGKDLPGSPVGCDTPELVSEFLQSTSDISPICTPQNSFDEAKDGPVVPRPHSLLPTKAYNTPVSSSARSTRLLQMVNPESVLNKDPFVGVKQILPRKRKIEQPKRKEQYEILTFSREIPSPLSVPGNSILKRRLHHSDDIHLNPPKRKRVNFSDPAITKKKIYLTDFPDLDNLDDVNATANSDFDRLLNGNQRKEFPLEVTCSKKSIIDTIRCFCDKKFEDDDFIVTLINMSRLLNVSTIKEIIVEFLSVVNSKLKNGTAAALAEETDKQVILDTTLTPLLKTKNDTETYVDIFIFFLKKLKFIELQDFIDQLKVLLGNEFEQFVAGTKENDASDDQEVTVINKEPTTVHELLNSAKRIVENLSTDDKRKFFIDFMKFTAENCVADDQTVAVQMQCLLDIQRRKMEH